MPSSHARKEETPTAARRGGKGRAKGGGRRRGVVLGRPRARLTFEGEANPRRRLQGRASAGAQGQQEEPGSRCCHGNSHAGSPQRSKSGQEKKKAEEWTIITGCPVRHTRHKKRERRARRSDLSHQKFGLQPSELRRIVWQQSAASETSHLLWKI